MNFQEKYGPWAIITGASSGYRDIEQRVPQYMVASYLGITPEFLSSLRKKALTNLS